MSTQKRKDVLEDKQCVILKGRRDGISILLDDKTSFSTIKKVLRDRVASSRNFFDGAETSVNFKGRKLTAKEEATLLGIIQSEADFNIATVEEQVDEKPPLPEIKLIPASPLGKLPAEMETFYYRGGVRSGQIVRQNGSVVIIGDVNPGAEIYATGNIIVLGSLKGSAWAGAPGNTTGDTNCFVAATNFQPTQIRIAHVVAYIPEGSSQMPHGNGSWAYIKDGEAYIAPL